jgi:putative addiction module component (TIGR02574 family)
MIATADMILAEALRLPVEDRSRIASRLIESVDDDDDFELSPAWDAEIARRMENVRSGKSRRIPHEEAMAEMREVLAGIK